MNQCSTCDLLLAEKNQANIQNFSLKHQVFSLTSQLAAAQVKLDRLQNAETQAQMLRADMVVLQEQLYSLEEGFQSRLLQLESQLTEIHHKKQDELHQELQDLKSERDSLMSRLMKVEVLVRKSCHETQNHGGQRKLLEMGNLQKQTCIKRSPKILTELPSIQEGRSPHKDTTAQLELLLQASTFPTNKSYNNDPPVSITNQSQLKLRQSYQLAFHYKHIQIKGKNQFLTRTIRIHNSQNTQSMPHLPHPLVISYNKKKP